MNDHISTYLRIKPVKNCSDCFEIDQVENHRLNVNLESDKCNEYIDNTKLNHTFCFNGIIDSNSKQEEVFELIGIQSLTHTFDGFNSTIFVYGQTGSGKTYTLTGGPDRYCDRGLIPRTITTLFKEMKSKINCSYTVSISYFQIYNDQGYDLLAGEAYTSLDDLPRMKVLEDESGKVHLRNLSSHIVSTEENALNLLFRGDTNRVIAETAMNQTSSRSHCVFSISLEVREGGSDTVRRSKLNLVDLAGSERVAKTHSSGAVLKEAKYINSSLFYLEAVIAALHERANIGRNHIPYRNSLLTLILRDSLGGNCKTAMIATISPDAAHTDESLSTCRFAQRVSQVSNRAHVNEEADPAMIVARLKSEIVALKEEVAFLRKSGNRYSDNDADTDGDDSNADIEVKDFRARVIEYCSNQSPSSSLPIDDYNFSDIKQCFSIFKDLVNSRKCTTIVSEKEEKEVSEVVFEKRVVSNSSSPNRSIWVAMSTDVDSHRVVDSIKDSAISNLISTPQSKITSVQASESWAQAVERRQKDRKSAFESKILHTKLFGVPPPSSSSTQATLDNPVEAYKWFEVNCRYKLSLDEHLNELKTTIAQAKLFGESANTSRDIVNQLKQDKDGSSDEDDRQRLYIDEEIRKYKSNCDALRVLKVKIENIKLSIEKYRGLITKQFEQWYSFLQTNHKAISFSSIEDGASDIAS